MARDPELDRLRRELTATGREASALLTQIKHRLSEACEPIERESSVVNAIARAVGWAYRPTVLLVDDEAQNLRAIELDLGDACRVITATSAADALRVMEQVTPDVVLSDVRMPGMGGVELAGQIAERWPHVQVYLLTAYPPSVPGPWREVLVKPVARERLLWACGVKATA